MSDAVSILNEPRFQAPKDWFEGRFNVASDRFLRYGQLIPDDTPRATIVIVPGNQEAYEKYFEFIHDLKPYDNGYRIFIYDPFGQGESGRELADEKKMHSVGFGRDIADLNAFMEHIVLPNHDDNYPLITIGHSKGSHFLMRYLSYTDHPVTKAVFVVPMLGVQTGVPNFFARFIISGLYHFGFDQRYVPGAWTWREDEKFDVMQQILSSDPVRGRVRHLWSLKRPKQRMSAVTIGWLYHAFQSIEYLNKPAVLQQIKIPSMIVTALGDKVVNIPRQERAVGLIPSCRHVKVPVARHDIWMEGDAMRDPFIKAVRDFIF